MQNFGQYDTRELLRKYRWHENDRGTMILRMLTLEKIYSELKRRGIDPNGEGPDSDV